MVLRVQLYYRTGWDCSRRGQRQNFGGSQEEELGRHNENSVAADGLGHRPDSPLGMPHSKAGSAHPADASVVLVAESYVLRLPVFENGLGGSTAPVG